MSKRDPQVLAIALIVLAVSALAIQDSIIKWLSDDFPLYEIVFVRAIFGVAITLIFVKLEGGLGEIFNGRAPALVGRSLFLVVANIFYFGGLASMPLAETMAIFFAAPLFITALSIPILGEKVGLQRWAAVLVGLVGVIVMLRPDSGAIRFVALLPVAAAFSYAFCQLLTRRLGVTSKASVMALYVHMTYLVIGSLMGLVTGDGRFAGSGNPTTEFLFRAWIWPSWNEFALLAICGFLTSVAGYSMAQGYRLAQANLLAPFEYSGLPIAVIMGVLLWGQWPDTTAWIGTLLIVGAGLFILYRETVRGRQISLRRPLPRSR